MTQTNYAKTLLHPVFDVQTAAIYKANCLIIDEVPDGKFPIPFTKMTADQHELLIMACDVMFKEPHRSLGDGYLCNHIADAADFIGEPPFDSASLFLRNAIESVLVDNDGFTLHSMDNVLFDHDHSIRTYLDQPSIHGKPLTLAILIYIRARWVDILTKNLEITQ